MDNKLLETEKYNQLFDYYQVLLTDKQQTYYKMYYFEDYSLGEIASSLKLSRNAIYDQLKTVQKLLIDYENKLNLYKNNQEAKKVITKLEKKYQDSLLEDLKNIL